MRMKRTTLILLLTIILLLSSCTSTAKTTTTTSTTTPPQTTEAIAQTDLPFGAEGLERGLFDGLEWGMSEEEIREKYGEENVGDDLSKIPSSDVKLPYDSVFGLDNKFTINGSYMTTNDTGLVMVYLPLHAIGNNVYDYLITTLDNYFGEAVDIQLFDSRKEYVWIVNNSAILCWIDLDKGRVDLFFEELEFYKSQENSIFQK